MKRKELAFLLLPGYSLTLQKRGTKKEAHGEEGWYILWGPGSKKQKIEENHAHAVDGLCRDRGPVVAVVVDEQRKTK